MGQQKALIYQRAAIICWKQKLHFTLEQRNEILIWGLIKYCNSQATKVHSPPLRHFR